MTNVYNIPSDGMLKVNFTGGYLSRRGFTAISIRMDPDSVYSYSDLDPFQFVSYRHCSLRCTPLFRFVEMATMRLHPVFYRPTIRPIG